MAAITRRRARAAELRRRIANTMAQAKCVVLDCNQPTTARAGRGLNRHYCQRHVEHYRRHGSYSKASYSARDLGPHRDAAHEWLQAHCDLPQVRAAVANVTALYERAGHPEEAFRLTGKSPELRARNVWAKLRHCGVDPLRALAVWAGVELCHASDPQPERKPEYRWVQVAKVIHRIAGGSHKLWRSGDAGGAHSVELHVYPASRGLVLRHIGEDLDCAALVLRGSLGTPRAT